MQKINIYSWLLLVLYIAVCFAMDIFSFHTSTMDYLLGTAPIIFSYMIGAEILNYYVEKKRFKTVKSQRFFTDFFFVNFTFLVGVMLSLFFETDNADVLGWWPFIIYISVIQGTVYSVIYSLFSKLMEEHIAYTYLFSLITAFPLTFNRFFPIKIAVGFDLKIPFSFAFPIFLILIHSVICVSYFIWRRKCILNK